MTFSKKGKYKVVVTEIIDLKLRRKFPALTAIIKCLFSVRRVLLKFSVSNWGWKRYFPVLLPQSEDSALKKPSFLDRQHFLQNLSILKDDLKSIVHCEKSCPPSVTCVTDSQHVLVDRLVYRNGLFLCRSTLSDHLCICHQKTWCRICQRRSRWCYSSADFLDCKQLQHSWKSCC